MYGRRNFIKYCPKAFNDLKTKSCDKYREKKARIESWQEDKKDRTTAKNINMITEDAEASRSTELELF